MILFSSETLWDDYTSLKCEILKHDDIAPVVPVTQGAVYLGSRIDLAQEIALEPAGIKAKQNRNILILKKLLPYTTQS